LCSHHLLSNPTKPDNDNDGGHFVFFFIIIHGQKNYSST
jgi:hypothetical protein